eukprot:gene18099-9349_t
MAVADWYTTVPKRGVMTRNIDRRHTKQATAGRLVCAAASHPKENDYRVTNSPYVLLALAIHDPDDQRADPEVRLDLSGLG